MGQFPNKRILIEQIEKKLDHDTSSKKKIHELVLIK